jgi:hypothetical protein
MQCGTCERPSERVVSEAAKAFPSRKRRISVKTAKSAFGSVLSLAKNRKRIKRTSAKRSYKSR